MPYALNARTHSDSQAEDLLSSRHDKVKLSIERLSDRGVIDLPPVGEDQTERSHGHTDRLVQHDNAFGDVVLLSRLDSAKGRAFYWILAFFLLFLVTAARFGHCFETLWEAQIAR